MTENETKPRCRRTENGRPNRLGLSAADTSTETRHYAGAAPDAAPADHGGAAVNHALERTLEALSVDHESAQRIQKLPHDIGWLLVTAGMVGMVMPGVLGTPFLVLGGLMLMPTTNRRAEHWLAGHAPKIFKGSIRQINRFLDDLERRYPHSPRKGRLNHRN